MQVFQKEQRVAYLGWLNSWDYLLQILSLHPTSCSCEFPKREPFNPFSHHHLWLKWIPPRRLLRMPMFCTGRGSPHVLQTQQDPWHCEQFWRCYLCGCWKVPQGQIFRESNFQVPGARNQQCPCLDQLWGLNCVMGHCLFWAAAFLIVTFSVTDLGVEKGETKWC